MSEAKPFVISKWQVMRAFELVKANAGAAGVDKQSLSDYGRYAELCITAIMRSIELCRVKQLRASQRQNRRHTARSRTLHNNYSVFRNFINASDA